MQNPYFPILYLPFQFWVNDRDEADLTISGNIFTLTFPGEAVEPPCIPPLDCLSSPPPIPEVKVISTFDLEFNPSTDVPTLEDWESGSESGNFELTIVTKVLSKVKGSWKTLGLVTNHWQTLPLYPFPGSDWIMESYLIGYRPSTSLQMINPSFPISSYELVAAELADGSERNLSFRNFLKACEAFESFRHRRLSEPDYLNPITWPNEAPSNSPDGLVISPFWSLLGAHIDNGNGFISGIEVAGESWQTLYRLMRDPVFASTLHCGRSLEPPTPCDDLEPGLYAVLRIKSHWVPDFEMTIPMFRVAMPFNIKCEVIPDQLLDMVSWALNTVIAEVWDIIYDSVFPLLPDFISFDDSVEGEMQRNGTSVDIVYNVYDLVSDLAYDVSLVNIEVDLLCCPSDNEPTSPDGREPVPLPEEDEDADAHIHCAPGVTRLYEFGRPSWCRCRPGTTHERIYFVIRDVYGEIVPISDIRLLMPTGINGPARSVAINDPEYDGAGYLFIDTHTSPADVGRSIKFVPYNYGNLGQVSFQFREWAYEHPENPSDDHVSLYPEEPFGWRQVVYPPFLYGPEPDWGNLDWDTEHSLEIRTHLPWKEGYYVTIEDSVDGCTRLPTNPPPPDIHRPRPRPEQPPEDPDNPDPEYCYTVKAKVSLGLDLDALRFMWKGRPKPPKVNLKEDGDGWLEFIAKFDLSIDLLTLDLGTFCTKEPISELTLFLIDLALSMIPLGYKIINVGLEIDPV